MRPIGPRDDEEDDEFLTRREVGKKVRKSVKTLEAWTRDGKGPPSRKIGGSRLYPLKKFKAYLAGR